MSLLWALLLSAAASPASATRPVVAVEAQPVRANYAVSRAGRAGPALRPHRAAGYQQRVQLRPGGRSEVTVFVDPRPLLLDAPWPPRPENWPAEARRRLDHDEECAPTPVVEAWGERLAAGASTELEVADRILGWVSHEIRPVDMPPHDDSPAAALGTREASCVGRSRLSVALLRAAGLPARTIHGLVLPTGLDRGEPVGSAEFTLHRHVEVWLTGAGWVPSDPGQSLHLVDTRHLVLAVDGEDYDPEHQRDLLVTLSSAPGPFQLAGSPDSQHRRSPLVRRALIAVPRSAP